MNNSVYFRSYSSLIKLVYSIAIIYMLMVVALLIPIGIFITRIIKHQNDSEYAFSKFKNIIVIMIIPFTILEHQRKAIIYEGVLEKKSYF